jgi:subtilisin family serine protease
MLMTTRKMFASAGLAALLSALLALPATAAATVPGETGGPGETAAVAASAETVGEQQQSVFTMMNVQPAWQVTEGSGVTVAVLDSGVNGNVADLTGAVTQGPDFTTLTTPSTNHDWGQHGTWMASIIAGNGAGITEGGEEFEGVAGIAPAAKILSIRVIPDADDPQDKKYNDQSEQAVQNELADGINTAVKDGAQVISMSIGYSAPSGVVRAAVDNAYAHGVVLVASSGNSGKNDTQHATSDPNIAPVSYPAEYPGVLSVGAVTEQGAATPFSSGNLSVRISAPGDEILAQGNNGSIYQVTGTSPACALVAGVAALIKSRYPKISAEQVDEALISTAQQTPAGSYSVLTGFGVVDADAALAKAGQLMGEKPQKSQVSTTAHFGDGPRAVPAPPVTRRGGGALTASVILAILAALALGLGGVRLYRSRPQ